VERRPRSLPLVDLAPVTELFGTNRSCKTSILKILPLLKQTSASTERLQALQLGDERTPVDLESISDVLFDHNESEALSCAIGWKDMSSAPQAEAGRSMRVVRRPLFPDREIVTWQSEVIDYESSLRCVKACLR
jgi:hypothetical protein